MPWLRKLLLALALLATIVASVVDPSGPETVQPRKAGPVAARAAAPPPAGGLGPASARQYSPRAPFGPPGADVFAAHNWQAPPAPAPAPVPVPAPKLPAPLAPPLPFVYLGKLLQQDEVVAFLGLGARTYLLRRGDLVADYRVIEITPAEIDFLYLPLNEKQALTFGSAN